MKCKKCRPLSEQLESRALLTTFYVTSREAAGPGTLRAAINMANQTPGADVIAFQLSGGNSITIGNAALPAITGKVVIDGYTQTGAVRNTSTDPEVNNAEPGVELISSGARPAMLTINPRGGGSQIRGISFVERGTGTSAAILINQADLVTVDGDSFSAEGQSRMSVAVRVVGGDRNTIGGDVSTDPALQNVLSGYTTGVEFTGTSRYNAVVGNIIGGEVYPSRVPLQAVGVWLRPSASNNTIVNNFFYKNQTAVKNESVGNVIEGNTIVPV